MKRREWLTRVGTLGAAALAAPCMLHCKQPPPPAPRTWSATGKASAACASFDQTMQRFMQARAIPGGALAVARRGKLVFARGYNWTNDGEVVQPDSLFRIASISKPITSAAIMHLAQTGKLKLWEKPLDILGLQPPAGRKADPRLKDVTILHLLQHTGGWDREKSFDPMFQDPRIAKELRLSLPVSKQHITTWMAGQPLDFTPGERHAYSNYGYCLLGRIIEKVTGKSYGEFVKEAILKPLGITRMSLGRGLLEHRQPGEVRYYTHHKKRQSVYSDKRELVPPPYGPFNLENLDAHGGWLASAIDLVRFAAAFDTDGGHPLLSRETIEATFRRPAAAPVEAGSYYACGWLVRPVGESRNTWHNGSIPGTHTLLVRRHDGLSWAALFNQRDDPSGLKYQEIDPLLHPAANAVKPWPDHDLFKEFSIEHRA